MVNYSYDRRVQAAEDHINKILRSLATHYFGSYGKLWSEQSRSDDTIAFVFPDDQGTWPGRGGARFTDIATLLRKSKGMPGELPEFLRSLDKTLKGFAKEHREDLREALQGTNKVTIRWKDTSGEDEEWSIDINSEYS